MRKEKMSKNELVLSLTSILSLHPQIVFAYLFGSQAKGKETEKSDVDVAIWVKGKIDKLRLMGEIEEVTKRPADLVILNSASALLRHQVLKHGVLLFCKDKEVLTRFKVWTMKEYEDFRWLQEQYVRLRYGG